MTKLAGSLFKTEWNVAALFVIIPTHNLIWKMWYKTNILKIHFNGMATFKKSQSSWNSLKLFGESEINLNGWISFCFETLFWLYITRGRSQCLLFWKWQYSRAPKSGQTHVLISDRAEIRPILFGFQTSTKLGCFGYKRGH